MTNINFSLSQRLGNQLKQRGLKLALAESCTGGNLAEEVTAMPGSSQWFEYGVVVYSNEAKTALIDVKPKTLETHGAVSEAVACEMALGIINQSNVDVSLSVTGIAGPRGGSEDKPVGTVWFGMARKGGGCAAKCKLFSGGRKNVRVEAVAFALNWLLEVITKL